MANTKETPWTDRKLMYKDGNVDVYRYFNWETWKRMTAGERAMWTEFSEATPAPISKEVIEFNKKQKDWQDKELGAIDENAIKKAAAKAVRKKAEKEADEFLEKHKDKTRDVGDEMLRRQHAEIIYDKELKAIKAKLKERKIKFAGNSKLETLQKKLADADNTE